MTFDAYTWEPDADERAAADARHWPVCACCAQVVHRTEIANRNDWFHVDAMQAEHDGPICRTCADAWGVCEECDTLTSEREPTLHDGWLCEPCAADLPASIADRAAEDAGDLVREGV